MIQPRFRWRYPDPTPPDPSFVEAVAGLGGSPRLARVLARRGVVPGDLGAWFGVPEASLHDPALLPDAALVVERVRTARADGEKVLVFGDFDADGLTGLAILVRALRSLGIDASPHVPSRLDDGHGLSLRSIEVARSEGRTLIITVDTGSSSVAEVAAARTAGIDVIITDHHQVPPEPPAALALVNAHRPDSQYPDKRLAGSGIALKVAALLCAALDGRDPIAVTADLADLAAIGTVADVAPIAGENRAIARLGLRRIAEAPRPGIAALIARARITPPLTLESLAFHIAPRLNAAGRVGEAGDAAALLLADTREEADELAGRLEAANMARRDVTRSALGEVRELLVGGADPGPAVLVRGEWPVGVLGLIAGRLAEEHARPAVVASLVGEHLRASCRAPEGYDLAAALQACSELLVRHGGHRGAAGFELAAENWATFVDRFQAQIASAGPSEHVRELALDLAISARTADYQVLRELEGLEPVGPGNPRPIVGIHGLTVLRVRPATGGHAQLTLRREVDVLDGIAFDRGDLVETVRPGDVVDVAAHLASHRFGGYESLQLEILDVAMSRTITRGIPASSDLPVAGPTDARAVV